MAFDLIGFAREAAKTGNSTVTTTLKIEIPDAKAKKGVKAVAVVRGNAILPSLSEKDVKKFCRDSETDVRKFSASVRVGDLIRVEQHLLTLETAEKAVVGALKKPSETEEAIETAKPADRSQTIDKALENGAKK